MAYTAELPSDVEGAQLARYANRFTDKDTSAESFLGKLSRAEGQALWTIQKKLERISLDSIPQQGTTYAILASWATVLGLSDGAGGYGPLKAVAASGGVGTATGTPAAAIPDGRSVVGGDGVTLFAVNGAAVVGAGGTVPVNLVATTPGLAGNLGVGAKVRFVSPPAGVQATISITGALSGGLDAELPSALLARILRRLQIPPRGGIANDYRTWLEQDAVDLATGVQLAITRAFIYPLRSGTGTVDSVIIQGGSGTARGYGGSTSVSTKAQAYLETVRPEPVEGASVAPPSMSGGRALTVHVNPIALLSVNDFEFNAVSGGPYTVAAAGTTSVTLNANCTDLDTQVNTNLRHPRIQVCVTGEVLPFIAKVTAYNPGTKVATLDTAFTTLPTVGDAVYAGSVMVTPIAQAVVDLVDGLGPSRASGCLDSNDYWNDTLEIVQLASAAINVLDASGRPYAVNLSANPQIAVGGGAAAALDVRAADNGLGAPELLYLKSVRIHP